jgi:RNA polymerase sigma-70 factor (ECF subfamily)
MGDETEYDPLIQRALAGEEDALADLFDIHRGRLERMVNLRMDHRLHARLDASDVLQEAYIDLSQRLPEYAKQQQYPFFLWLRLVTGQRLAQIHRKHLGAAMRNVDLEVSLYRQALPQVSTFFLASRLIGQFTSVSQKAMRAEMQVKLQEVLNTMDPNDREVLALRHFEELSNEETAQVLDITKSTASKRYIRALRRLKETLEQIHGFRTETIITNEENRDKK